MNTKFRRWAVRIVGTVALPAALAVGVGAASASAQPTVAAHVTSSTQQARPDYWHPAGFYYNYYQCVSRMQYYRHHGYSAYCQYYGNFRHYGYHYPHVWVLWVRF